MANYIWPSWPLVIGLTELSPLKPCTSVKMILIKFYWRFWTTFRQRTTRLMVNDSFYDVTRHDLPFLKQWDRIRSQKLKLSLFRFFRLDPPGRSAIKQCHSQWWPEFFWQFSTWNTCKVYLFAILNGSFTIVYSYLPLYCSFTLTTVNGSFAILIVYLAATVNKKYILFFTRDVSPTIF